MKKYLHYILFLTLFQGYSQYNENAPWMKDLYKKSVSKSSMEFSEISTNFNHYWKGKNSQKKGSGFKPFKRWENHWKNQLTTKGAIATPDLLWKAWNEKQKLAGLKTNLSNWQSKGPYTTNLKTGQGRVNTFIIDPNNSETYYVGAPSGGLWKSTDSGENWLPLSDHIPQIGISGIAIDPNNSNIIYIATGDDDAMDTYSVGVLKSLDGGISWNKTGLDFSTTNSISNEIYIHPSNSNIIWVSTSKGFFKSIDAGLNWNKKISGNIMDFKLNPEDPNIIYAVSASEYWKSTNGGENFTKISSGLPVSSSRFAIDITEADGDYVYILSANSDNKFQGVYKSINSGDSFTKTLENDDIFGESSQSWYDMTITVSSTNPDIVFVGVLDIWKSTDGGDDFTQINRWWDTSEPSYTHADIHFLRFFNDKLYAGTDGGIYESSNDGSNFQDLTENLNISQYYKIATAKNSISNIVGGLQDNGGFAFSDDVWKKYHGGDGMDCIISPNDPNLYYGFTQFGGSLNVTYDAGVTSGTTIASAPDDEVDAPQDLGGNWVTPLAVNNEGDIYAGYSKLYKLNINSWEAVSSDEFGGDLDNIEISHSNIQVIYVSRSNVLFKSINGGSSFSQISFSFPSDITSIAVNHQHGETIYISNGGFDGKIYKSTDGGDNWSDMTLNLPSEPKLVIKHQNQSLVNDLYLGTSLGVYHINDNMSEWEAYDNNLPNVPIYDIEINPEEEMITVGSYGRGVWQSPIQVTRSDFDISLLSINNSNSIHCDGVTPFITIFNNGLSSFDQIDINYTVDNDPYSHTVYGIIEPGEIKEIELPNNNLVNFGNHDLLVETIVLNDAYSNNNSLISSFNSNSSGEGLYINTFGDVNPDTWLVSTSSNTIDLWEKGLATSTKFNSKFDNSYNTISNGNYPNNNLSYLITPCYDLTNLVNPILKFDMVFDIEEDWDVLYMEYTLDNGKNWAILGSANDPNWYNSSFIDSQRPITVGKQWTGTDVDIKEYSYDLEAYSSKSSMIFRFVFASDQSENGEGVAIDNFIIDASSIILSVDEEAKNFFTVYPNPSSSKFQIQRPNNTEMQVAIYDISGKLIFEKKNITDSNYTLILPDNVAKGVYILKLTERNKNIAKQLIVN